MASPQLNERHRAAQQQVRAGLLRDFLQLWPTLNQKQLSTTFPGWAGSVHRLITQHRTLSAEVSRQYLRAARREAGITRAARHLPVAPHPLSNTQRALTVTALITLRRAASRGIPPAQADRVALTASAGAAAQMTADAARDLVIRTVTSEEEAVSWYRDCQPGCCYFCAMLASRGEVYKTQQAASFRSHGSCKCQAVPVYTAGEPLPEFNIAMSGLWSESTTGYRGHGKQLAFRRAYEQLYPPRRGEETAAATAEPQPGRSR